MWRLGLGVEEEARLGGLEGQLVRRHWKTLRVGGEENRGGRGGSKQSLLLLEGRLLTWR